VPERDLTPTQSAFLELKEERTGMQEGYRFLDEKRLILAAEILAELGRYESVRTTFEQDYALATAALAEAVARHGVEDLGLYPAAAPVDGRFDPRPRSILGVAVYDLSCQLADPPPALENPLASPEAERCRALFRGLIPGAACLAALAGNLVRLREDYARTARRARALEDVLLPEIEETLRTVEGALEESEREEGVRTRWIPG
jgi:V/A-type H+/Na+-transporting ATPase subunit D